MKAYQMKITIKDSHPPIWRRFIVPAELSFSQLSVVLNEVMGWCGYHLFSFEFNNIGLCLEEADENGDDWPVEDFDRDDASVIMLEAYLDKEKRFTYVYDFGDDWRHAVVVEKIIEEYEFNYPVVLKFKGETPYEDCGGIYGYYQLLETLKNPSDPEYKNLKDWTEGHFIEKYDIEKVNHRLKGLKLGNKKSKAMRQSQIYEEISVKEQGFKRIQGIKEPVYGGFDDFDEFDEISEEDEAFFDEILKEFEKNMAGYKKGIPETDIGDVTLQDIFRDYTKDVLVDIAKLHHIRGYSKYNKEGLVEFLAKNLLDKEVMRRYFTFVSDEELDIITKFSETDLNSLPSDEDIEKAIDLVAGGYCGVLGMHSIVVPKEVAQTYREICDSEWKKTRRMALELCTYLNGAAELYGVCPMSFVLEIYNKYTGKHVEEQTMYSFCELIPQNKCCFTYNGMDVIHKFYGMGKRLEELREKQKDKPFYRPSRKEIELLGKEGCLPFDKYMEDLCVFIYYQLEVEQQDAEELCRYTQYVFRTGGAVEDVIEFMEDNELLELPGEVCQIKKLLTAVWAHTRKRENRGNLPDGVSSEGTLSINKRDSGSSILFNKPKETIVKFPVDLKKKIYPNDPCPCGSGKKYKKCCGKNKN